MLETIIVIAVVVLAVGGAVAYIVRAKKNGARCIGCPSGGKCASHGCGYRCEGAQASESVEETKTEEAPCCCCCCSKEAE